MPKISPYPEEFKRDAVALFRSSGRPLEQLAKELGVSAGSLANSVKRTALIVGTRDGRCDRPAWDARC